MSRFNTGNPLGSGDPRDLDDNAKNMDLAINTDDPNWVDRFGRFRMPVMEQERQFLASQDERSSQFDADQLQRESEFDSAQDSREQRFNTFIASSGYEFVGDYAADIEITEYNQLLRDENGEFWRVSGQVDLPYVTTGDGIPEDDVLVPAGDAVLRQDLANPDMGAAMVAWKRTPLAKYVSDAASALNQQRVSIWEFAEYAGGYSDIVSPGDWDWGPAITEAASREGVSDIFFPTFTYKSSGSVIRKNISLSGEIFSIIELHATAPGQILIDAQAYKVPLKNIQLRSATGLNDGLSLIGFKHWVPGGGSTGRLIHESVDILDFSEACAEIQQAISYSWSKGSMRGGNYDIKVLPNQDSGMLSTTFDMHGTYLSGGKKAGLFTKNVFDVLLTKVIFEYGGSAENPNSAAMVNEGSTIVRVGCYFERNYRNLTTDSAIVTLSDRSSGSASEPDIFAYTPAAADSQKGSTEIYRNKLITRFIEADSFRARLELLGPAYFRDAIFANGGLVAAYGNIRLGSHPVSGRMDGYKSLTILSNMAGTGASGPGQGVDFGVSNSSAGSGSAWFSLYQYRSNTGVSTHKLAIATASGSSATDGPDPETRSIKLELNSAGALYPGGDNVQQLGLPSNRWAQIYAGNATINTSDGRSKKVRGKLTDAEIAAWERVQPLIFQWVDSIEEKGDAARLHAGWIAQEVEAAFANEGLDAARYGLLCIDEVFEDQVIGSREVKVPVMKKERRVSLEIEIIDGIPTQVEKVVETEVQEFEVMPVVDKSGNPVRVADDTGALIDLTHPVPKFAVMTEDVTSPVSVGTRYGIRYSQALIFEIAYLRSRIGRMWDNLGGG